MNLFPARVQSVCSLQYSVVYSTCSRPIWFLFYIYTAVQKFGISKIFNGVSDAHQGCIYLIKNTEKNSNVVKYYFNF